MSSAQTSNRITQWLIPAVLITVILAAGGFFAWATVDHFQTSGVRAEVRESAAERQELRDLAEKFVRELHSYGPDDLVGQQMQGYEDRVAPLMTAKFSAAFQQNLPITEATVSQFSARSHGEVTASGVVSLGERTAEVLVGGWLLLAYQHPELDEEIVGDQQPVRYRVVIQRIEGEWLVDRLCNVDDAADRCLGDDDDVAVPGIDPEEAPEGGTPDPDAEDDADDAEPEGDEEGEDQ